jgi:hypothetical protein
MGDRAGEISHRSQGLDVIIEMRMGPTTKTAMSVIMAIVLAILALSVIWIYTPFKIMSRQGIKAW